MAHRSPLFKASSRSAVSPDGRLVASLASSSVHVRSTESLQTVNVVKLPPDLSGPILALLWSPSSTKLLLSTVDQIRVLSALDHLSFNAALRNPLAGNGRPSHVQFGNDDNEVLVFSSFGLKLLVFELSTSKAVDISSPKFHHPSSATRSFSLRPATNHLALLTRVGGRDVLSIHSPVSRQLQRSWCPDTIDAQAVCWSPDGQLLLMWESPAHGWRLLLYTPDGQLTRTLGPSAAQLDPDATLRPGIRTCQFSPNKDMLALGDHSRRVSILSTSTWRESLALTHPASISPSETLQVWQEQLHGSSTLGMGERSFLRAAQEISPPVAGLGSAPAEPHKPSSDRRPGCSMATFDSSSLLLASRLEDSPSTLWIWDLGAAELRAVLIFHSSVDFSWHPSVQELLLVCAQDESLQNVSYVWDPLSSGPKDLLMQDYLPAEKGPDKATAAWVNWKREHAALLVSDAHNYFLSSMPDAELMPAEWADHKTSTLGGSPALRHGITSDDELQDVDESSILNDTFSFKHG